MLVMLAISSCGCYYYYYHHHHCYTVPDKMQAEKQTKEKYLCINCDDLIQDSEAVPVGVDYAMTFVMWMKHFFESQVRSINVNSPLKPLGSNVTIEQDNMSAIQLERNGLKSSSKRTKHINVRYFYITDRLKAGDVSRAYKPTGDMESDYLTKALQGIAFHAHRKTLMGLDGINEHMFILEV